MIGSYYSNRTKLGVDDTKRTERALRGIEGKHLTYRRTPWGQTPTRRGAVLGAVRSALWLRRSLSCSR
jgi:hypothetical protein